MSLEPEPDPADEQQNLGFGGDRNEVVIAYLEEHPEIDGVYSGGTWYQEAGNFGPFSGKWRGTTRWDRFTIMSNVPSYPADVWTLTEEKNIEAIAFASRFHLTDPEGTDLSDDISPDLARRWASGIYERGHNMLGPNMATGRFARTMVSYPAMSGEWIPRSPISTPTGVIAATTNHVGYHPLIKMYYEDGYLTAVEGGGTYGELARTHLWLLPEHQHRPIPILRWQTRLLLSPRDRLGHQPQVVPAAGCRHVGYDGQRAPQVRLPAYRRGCEPRT